MIVGSGLVAKAFLPYFADDAAITVFASGVSNSSETRAEEFLREETLLRRALERASTLFYFGSCSVLDPEMAETPYVKHKLRMEALVGAASGRAIFRLPQVVGRSSNPHLLTNFLYEHVSSGRHFKVWRHARRNLIDVDDVATIVTHLVQTGRVEGGIYNIASPFSVAIVDIVQAFELVLGRRADYSVGENGAAYNIDVPEVLEAASELGISFDHGYIVRTFRKYYGS
ncbi:NAD-dependent epimerase/dehydratase family protein [Agrobacterium sp. fls2-241-TYG-188a]|uniref:NAD-dependent epimerase/dehydratase family protein n=1 Tax=Agrobacterium sp. fls2-241-TYG-188a TaxID=3040275 RepID=UPI00254C6208|nr:NAD-dependent epimerase/dehydratase family protein [Agrobacterium sp. fls2-241-TYG-188a]